MYRLPANSYVRGRKGPLRLYVVSLALRHAGVLASGGEDRRICVWDLSRTEGAGDGANKPLIFMHSGHRGGVRALDGPCMPWKDWL